MKKNTGITLIALVITIIILIVLSVVTITTISGDNGLVEQAKNSKAVSSNEVASTEEDMNSVLKEYSQAMAKESEISLPENLNSIFVAEMNMGSGGDRTCHIVYDISAADVTSISFQIRRGGSQSRYPKIYFSEDGTTYDLIETMTTGAAYEYVDKEFDIPENYNFVKLEWEIGSDRAWFANIKFN